MTLIRRSGERELEDKVEIACPRPLGSTKEQREAQSAG